VARLAAFLAGDQLFLAKLVLPAMNGSPADDTVSAYSFVLPAME
jgi:hypothetical protein